MEVIEFLKEKIYPGRVIITFKKDNNFNQFYIITGRSPISKDRKIIKERDTLKVVSTGKYQHSSLTVYNAFRVTKGYYILTNGDHTDTIYKAINDNQNVLNALFSRKYEEDKYKTPRIFSIINFLKGEFLSGIIRSSEWDDSCIHQIYRFEDIPEGKAIYISTYEGNSWEPCSCKEICWVDIKNISIEKMWEALSPETRVSLSFIQIGEGGSSIEIINR